MRQTNKNNWQIKKYLGAGGEGTAYILHNPETKKERVIKIFHQPIEPTKALEVYRTTVRGNTHGLSEISLLTNDMGQLTAVTYNYVPLYAVHSRFFHHFDQIGMVLFGSFCAMQNYLIKHSGICITDAAAFQFLLDRKGQFHFVDFGWALKGVQHQSVIQNGRAIYALLQLLLTMYGHSTGIHLHKVGMPDVVNLIEGTILDDLGRKHSWVKPILSVIRHTELEAFLAPDIYSQLAQGFRATVTFPLGVIYGSRFFRFLFVNLRGIRYKRPEPVLNDYIMSVVESVNCNE